MEIIITYKACDGTTFTDEKDCIKYEKRLKSHEHFFETFHFFDEYGEKIISDNILEVIDSAIYVEVTKDIDWKDPLASYDLPCKKGIYIYSIDWKPVDDICQVIKKIQCPK